MFTILGASGTTSGWSPLVFTICHARMCAAALTFVENAVQVLIFPICPRRRRIEQAAQRGLGVVGGAGAAGRGLLRLHGVRLVLGGGLLGLHLGSERGAAMD